MKTDINTCIQLIKSVINQLYNICKILLNLLKKNNSTDISDLNNITNYLKVLTHFKDNICPQLSEEYFKNNNKKLFNDLKYILTYFCKDVTVIINKYNLESLKSLLSDLTHSILLLLTTISTYSRFQIIKMNNTTQSIKSKKMNITQESNDVLILKEEFFYGLGYGFTKFFIKFADIISFKANSINNTWTSFINLLSKINTKFKSISKDSTINNYINILTSSEIGILIGSSIGLFVTFILIRKVFSKLVNYIRSKWSNLWN